MIIALLSAIVVDFAYSTRLESRTAGYARDESRARFLAASGYRLALGMLLADRTRDENRAPPEAAIEEETAAAADGLHEEWARIRDVAIPVGEAGEIVLRIEDEGSKINLNALIGSDGQPNDELLAQFEALLIQTADRLGVGIDQKEYPLDEIAAAVIDWIDPDEESLEGGFEDEDYEGYTTKNEPMDSITELRLISGVDDRLFEALEPYLTVYPYAGGESINLNTAPEALLATIQVGTEPASEATSAQAYEPLTEEDVEQILTLREEGVVFAGTDELAETLGYPTGTPFANVTFGSSIFAIHATGRTGEIESTIHAVIDRSEETPVLLYWRMG